MTQTLDKLSAAATQARVLESRVNNRWQVTLDFGDDKDAMRHFSDLYRTGQLVAVQPDDATVERVKDAIGTSLAYDIGMDVRAGSLTDDEKRKVARKAIAAMEGPKP